jgi:limonene-1,2-epoxide hydrolase
VSHNHLTTLLTALERSRGNLFYRIFIFIYNTKKFGRETENNTCCLSMDDTSKTQDITKLEPLTKELLRDLWSRTYNTQGKPDWSHLFPYYHDDIIFEDSIQRIDGKAEFIAMCNRLSDRCEKINMDILSVAMDGNQIFFQWKMAMSFKRWPNNTLFGCTRLTLADDHRIISQRDYFDLWGTILNGIPILRKSYWKFMRTYFG